MNFRSKIRVLYYSLKKVIADLKQLTKGQKDNYELLQLCHRIEKGLLVKNPKPLWGWEKAYRIFDLLQVCGDSFSTKTANAVLSAFLNSKEKSLFEQDKEKWTEFIKRTNYKLVDGTNVGGICCVKKSTFTPDEIIIIEKLFYTRHSCRDFSNIPVSNDLIEHAVEMALRCPSACNRQPFRVYVVEPSEIEKLLNHKLQYKANKILFITGDVRAFTSSELLDWLISPSIFAGYLTLSLHSLGIGSCVVRKDLVKESVYNVVVAKLAGISESERIVLEMNIGYYLDEYTIPISNRFEASKILKITYNS